MTRPVTSCGPAPTSIPGQGRRPPSSSGAAGARQIFERGGDWVSITSPARFLWIREHEPEVFRAMAHVGMLSDWVLTRLTGRFATDPSCGSSSDLFDLAQRDWSPETLRLIGVPPEVMPEVLEPGTVMGEVTDAAARMTGLRRGNPGRGRRRRHATGARGHRRHATRPAHPPRWHVLAAHRGHRPSRSSTRRRASGPCATRCRDSG